MLVGIILNNEMTKKCHQQINQRSHRCRETMVQVDGKDAPSVWKIAEKVSIDISLAMANYLTFLVQMDFHLPLFLIESESSGRSISPPSSFASGSEAETGEFPRIEEIIPISSIDEYEYTASRKGARCSAPSTTKSSNYHPTSTTTSVLPRESQQPLQVRIHSSYYS